MQFLNRIRQFFEDVLFPPLCLLCRAHLKAEEQPEWLCRNCAIPFDFPVGFFCPFCKRRSPVIPSCHPETRFAGIAPWSYERKIVRELIHLLKYESVKTAALPLGKELGSYLLKSMELGGISPTNFVIIPIPLHTRKLRKRGFNQSLLLACALELREVPLLEKTLIRTRPTLSQTTLENPEERTKNVYGSFTLRDPESVRGKNILLVDDVFTSGATMREAARILKKAGARRIIGLAAARA